jgi:hypothetical protein
VAVLLDVEMSMRGLGTIGLNGQAMGFWISVTKPGYGSWNEHGIWDRDYGA